MVAKSAIRLLYRHRQVTLDNAARDAAAAAWRDKHKSLLGAVPYFMGVFDTVAAVGMDRLLPNRDEEHLPHGLMYVRYALAIDEYRSDFRRVPWGSKKTIRVEGPGEPRAFEQIWFARNHADIGGSYPENESRLSEYLSNGSPISSVRACRARDVLTLTGHYLTMMHDEIMAGGVGGTCIPWGKKQRPGLVEGELHSTVIDRLNRSSVRNYTSYGRYRPLNLEKHRKAAQYFPHHDGRKPAKHDS